MTCKKVQERAAWFLSQIVPLWRELSGDNYLSYVQCRRELKKAARSCHVSYERVLENAGMLRVRWYRFDGKVMDYKHPGEM